MTWWMWTLAAATVAYILLSVVVMTYSLVKVLREEHAKRTCAKKGHLDTDTDGVIPHCPRCRRVIMRGSPDAGPDDGGSA